MGKEVKASSRGTVYLVGAGPGDPGLLTVKGAELLAQADAVVYDALSNPVLLDRVPAGAERIDVGKRAGRSSPKQPEVNRLLVELAGQHQVIVRLKGGDPFVFGRGAEEALALHEAGVPFEVVPGVTSGIGALTYAGIPLTHRGVACSATFVTGHRAVEEECGEGIGELVPPSGTVAVFMGLSRVAEVTRALVEAGRSPDTPAAVVNRGTLPDQRTVVGTLEDLAGRVREAGLEGPALIVVGEVVALRSRAAWFEERETEAGTEVEPMHVSLGSSI
ncbi:MAG: uroporphyrinogen-III C-methyltransferase [Gemmatimonadota bacterium]